MYYSQRQNDGLLVDECSIQFWNSFLAYIRQLIQQNYLSEKFSTFDESDHTYTTSAYHIEEEMLIKLGQHIELNRIATREKDLYFTNFQLDVVEFFYQYVSKPTSYGYDSYYKTSFPEKYDISKGRYDYTVSVNSIFERNNLVYRLEKGLIVRKHDKILDKSLSFDFSMVDEHLQLEVQQAKKLFFSRNASDHKTALTTIANAYERAKTLVYKLDKRSSAKEICKRIASDEEKLTEIFSNHFQYITDISNNTDIRHKETGKIIVNDKDLQEYLFYTYYNAIRLMVNKLPPPF